MRRSRIASGRPGRLSIRDVSMGLVVTVMLLGTTELLVRASYAVRNSLVTYVPLIYAPRDDSGMAPPWLDGFRILEWDPVFRWRGRASVHRRYIDVFSPAEGLVGFGFFSPRPEIAGHPTWELALNSEGFRDDELPKEKPPSTFRIVSLGDSWTFGANVDQHQTYPRRLSALARTEFPRARVEVINLGVMGYSSDQGRKLLDRRAIALSPDLVLLGFGMNDATISGWRDKDPDTTRPATALGGLERAAERLEVYRLVRYWALKLAQPPRTLGDHLRAQTDSEGSPRTREDALRVYGTSEPWTRVSLADYEKNIDAMIDLARSRGAGAILLFNELWGEGNPYRDVLGRLARRHGLPLVDSSALVAEARRGAEEEVERILDLRPRPDSGPASDGTVTVVFRVRSEPSAVGQALYIVGPHAQLGDLVPNKVRMYDDGTHGDQRARDAVWSYSAEFPRRAKVFYVYTRNGREGRWEGLDIPHIRKLTVDPPDGRSVIYQPIESFGSLSMQADGWHTNAVGYELIAQAVLARLRSEGPFQRYLTRVRGAAP